MVQLQTHAEVQGHRVCREVDAGREGQEPGASPRAAAWTTGDTQGPPCDGPDGGRSSFGDMWGGPLDTWSLRGLRSVGEQMSGWAGRARLLGHIVEPSYRQTGPREGCGQMGTGTELERSRRGRDGEAEFRGGDQKAVLPARSPEGLVFGFVCLFS